MFSIISFSRILFILILVTLSGCAAMRSYDNELTQTIDLVGKGQLDLAINQHDKSKSNDPDLLFYLEKGELLRLKKQYKDSTNNWLLANNKVNEWENEAKIRLSNIFENAGAVMVNDKTLRYDGHNYEKVMLSSQLALNYLLDGNWALARTEIKKTHEREAVIAEITEKEASEIANKSSEKGINTTFKDLNGYPIETLNSPDVMALKNGYQNAFSHYLAGFIYEALNEPGLAAPGYRQAIELQPGIKLLEDSLANLDTRNSTRKPSETDVLFIIESGVAPSLSSVTIPLPLLVSNLGIVPISFPVLHTDTIHNNHPHEITINNKEKLPLAQITSIENLSKRALRDDMPGIIFRGMLRATAKAMSQKALRDQGSNAATIAGLVLNVANIITESADERTWRTLPATINIGRVTLPSGNHEFSIGNDKKILNIQGSHAVIVARLISNQIFWSQPIYSQQMPIYGASTPQPLPFVVGTDKQRM